MKILKKTSAFTMLELVITLAILSALTVLAVRSIQQSLFAKTKIQNQLDDVSQIRDVLRLFERDVNLAVHYQDEEKKFNDLLKKSSQTLTQQQQAAAAQQQNGQTDPNAAIFDPNAAQNQQVAATQGQGAEPAYQRISPLSEFNGEDKKITFDTRNAVSQNSSDVVTLNYTVDSCKSGKGLCLFRQEKQFFDDVQDLTTNKIQLLSGITEISFKYLTEGETEWKDSWKTADKYPAAIQLTVTVERGTPDRSRKISLQSTAAIRFPNNQTASAAPAAPGATTPNNPTTSPATGTQGQGP